MIARHYHDTPLNRSEIPQSALDIEDKKRSNPLKWNGQFSPQLVDVLLRTYASTTSVVFDPFLGSGTLLLECGSHKLSGFGTEINPAAYYLSSTYQFINIQPQDRIHRINCVSKLLEDIFPPVWFGIPEPLTPDQLRDSLLQQLPHITDDLNKTILTALVILLDSHEVDLSVEVLFLTWKWLKKHLIQLPFSEQKITTFHADARAVPVESDRVDLVITSPPYINVFNYHQQYRKTVEALKWEVLKIAKSEIGANRKHRGNRFLTVVQYCLDMAQVLAELHRICHNDARMIFVVGRQSAVRGTTFFNGEIVTEIAEHAVDFRLETRQERAFKNRFGNKICEDILHFRPTQGYLPLDSSLRARECAQKILEKSLEGADRKIWPDLEAAIFQSHHVNPSPLFQPHPLNQ